MTKESKSNKFEGYAKIVTAVAALVGSVMIPLVLHMNAQQNQKSQVYADIMSKREQSDTAIRSEMFKTLIGAYLGGDQVNKNPAEQLEKQLVLLSLLTKNFQEFFDAKPLFEDLYRKLDRRDDNLSTRMKADLIDLASGTASKQAAMLSSIGGLKAVFDASMESTRCIRLYDSSGFNSIPFTTDGSCPTLPDTQTPGGNAGCDEQFQQKRTRYHSIDVGIAKVTENEVKLNLTVYEDFFNARNSAYCYSNMGKEISFSVSYFDMPFMDNTRLYDGSRFAIMPKFIDPASHSAELELISFKEEFMSLRDRPYFEQMLKTIQQ